MHSYPAYVAYVFNAYTGGHAAQWQRGAAARKPGDVF